MHTYQKSDQSYSTFLQYQSCWNHIEWNRLISLVPEVDKKQGLDFYFPQLMFILLLFLTKSKELQCFLIKIIQASESISSVSTVIPKFGTSMIQLSFAAILEITNRRGRMMEIQLFLIAYVYSR